MKREKRPRGDVSTSVLLPAALQKAVVKKAKQEERSLSAVIRCALKKELKFKKNIDQRNRGESFMEAIKFDGTANPWLIYKWPKTEIITGSQLVVGRGQEAVFFKSGLPLDAFGPGTYSLTANSLPLVQRISKPQSDDQSLFAAEIYFVNKIALLDLM
jgi:hypothetical protein